MIDFIYFAFLVYAFASVVSHRKTMLQYGTTRFIHAFLLISLIACASHWLLPLLFVSLRPFLLYPVPFVVVAYLPAIVLGRRLTKKYETAGTSLASDAEKAARNVTWGGAIGVVLVLFSWWLMFASEHLSKPY